MSFNKVILVGNLTADPELKQTQSGIPVVSFGIAVNRKYSKDAQQTEADFFNVTAWRETAEFVCRYFRKGSSVCVIGTLQNRSWTDRQGVKRYATDIMADEINFVDSKSDGDDGQQPTYNPQGAPNFEELGPDDDMPF